MSEERGGSGIYLTRDQIEAWVGHTLTNRQVEDIQECIPDSSIPLAVEVIAHETLDIPWPLDEREYRS